MAVKTPSPMHPAAPKDLELQVRERSGSDGSVASVSSAAPAVGGDEALLRARKAALEGELAAIDEKLQVAREGSLDDYFATPASTLLRERLPWLVGLLLLQSCAALVMDTFEGLLDRHLVIAFFVPMIVGTGGNAGNQPGVMTTRALSQGGVTRDKVRRLLRREAALAVVTGAVLAGLAFARVLAQYPDERAEALAIALAVFGMVQLAIVIGVGFSVGIDAMGSDAANGAAPLLTTVADLLGISLLCGISALLLHS